jgi:uncharacterized protein YecE (DUF72 family)
VATLGGRRFGASPARLAGGYPYHMARILVGTTSWTEAMLIESGHFYPPGVHTAEERLRYYASRFPAVEVDNSYYGLPSARNAGLWALRTPAGFVIDVKAFGILTLHQTPPDALTKDIGEVLAPMAKKHLYCKDLAPDTQRTRG